MAKIRITQIKSGIGHPEDQRGTLKTLGLRRIRHSVVHDDSASLRGMINKVRHLVTIEEVI
ncbi:MAG: 50S ribosomal protein L30 [Dehalococcoidia bacterium]|nr:50S ribosomal protein L30 [Dehalococcoidia bacterium]